MSDATADHEVVIKVRDDGPYKVTGPVRLVDASGRPFAVAAADLVLCRCGASATRPLCDGSHRRRGFDGTTTVPVTDDGPPDG